MIVAGDTIEGAAYLAVFLVLVFIGSRIMVRVNTARFNRYVAPLLPLINGRATSGGDQAMMEGTYGGRPVTVSIAYKVTSHVLPGTNVDRRNLVEITMSSVPGREGWKVRYHAFDGKDWRATSADDALAASLTNAGAVSDVQERGVMAYVTYSAPLGQLTFIEDISPRTTPPESRLQAALDLLVRLDAMNQRVNPA
ncbi:MAG: hypothetical protein ABJA80_06785 [bacterium]